MYDLAHHAHWQSLVRKSSVYSKWNIRHAAVFIHAPKTAGFAVYAKFGIDTIPNGPDIPAYAYQWSDPDFFDRAFKFCVVRNPWDRLVSAFHFLKNSPWPDDQVWAARHLSHLTSFPAFLWALEEPLFRHVVLTQ